MNNTVYSKNNTNTEIQICTTQESEKILYVIIDSWFINHDLGFFLE